MLLFALFIERGETISAQDLKNMDLWITNDKEQVIDNTVDEEKTIDLLYQKLEEGGYLRKPKKPFSEKYREWLQSDSASRFFGLFLIFVIVITILIIQLSFRKGKIDDIKDNVTMCSVKLTNLYDNFESFKQNTRLENERRGQKEKQILNLLLSIKENNNKQNQDDSQEENEPINEQNNNNQEDDSIFNILDQKIAKSELSIKIIRVLIKNNIDTFGDLVSCKKSKIKDLKNLGKKSVIEIENALEQRNIRFQMLIQGKPVKEYGYGKKLGNLQG